VVVAVTAGPTIVVVPVVTVIAALAVLCHTNQHRRLPRKDVSHRATYVVEVRVTVAVRTGMLRYEEQNVVAALCCFNSVTASSTIVQKRLRSTSSRSTGDAAAKARNIAKR